MRILKTIHFRLGLHKKRFSVFVFIPRLINIGLFEFVGVYTERIFGF